jgi:hypothetical protein
MVLKAPDVPSVLLETGYISNDDDLALLTSIVLSSQDRDRRAPRDRRAFRAPSVDRNQEGGHAMIRHLPSGSRFSC